MVNLLKKKNLRIFYRISSCLPWKVDYLDYTCVIYYHAQLKATSHFSALFLAIENYNQGGVKIGQVWKRVIKPKKVKYRTFYFGSLN